MNYSEYTGVIVDQCTWVDGINFPLTAMFIVLVCICAYFSYRKGALAGAEITLTQLEIDNIITIDEEGTIRAICAWDVVENIDEQENDEDENLD